MSLFNTKPLTKGVSKLGSAIVTTVQPVANLIEMASESSLKWSESHAADLEAKTERRNKVRAQTNKDLLIAAIAEADKATIETNKLKRSVQLLVKEDSVSDRIHKVQCDAFDNIDESVILKLASKANLTSADIRREAKIGSVASEVPESDEPKSNFDIGAFTTS